MLIPGYNNVSSRSVRGCLYVLSASSSTSPSLNSESSEFGHFRLEIDQRKPPLHPVGRPDEADQESVEPCAPYVLLEKRADDPASGEIAVALIPDRTYILRTQLTVMDVVG